MTPKNTPTTETRFWVHSAKMHASQAVDALKEQKKIKNHATPHIFSGHGILHVGRTVGPKRAKFQVNRLRGFGAPGAENEHPPLTWQIAFKTVYTLTMTTATSR